MKKNSIRVSIAEAAETLGIGQQAVREWCKHGIIPCAVIDKKVTGKKVNQYFISRPKFEEFLGTRS